jgi:hypothetical protein
VGVRLLSLDAVRPTVRSVTPSAWVGMLLATLPAVLTVVLGGSDLGVAVVFAAVALGSLLAFAIDDPAAPVFAASPTPLVVRRALRVVVLLPAAALAGGLVGLLVVRFHEDPPLALGERAGEAAVAAGLAIASAAWLARRTGERRPGSLGVLFGLIGPALVSALAVRVDGLPMLGSASNASRWWWVAIAAWTAGVWWSRDLARR